MPKNANMTKRKEKTETNKLMRVALTTWNCNVFSGFFS